MLADSFATVLSEDGAIQHIPLLLQSQEGDFGALYGHITKGNALNEAILCGGTATAIFTGPHAYISTRWYVSTKNVPTWNYAVAHARGALCALSEEETELSLFRLMDRYESGGWEERSPKAFIRRLMPGITGFRLNIEKLDGTFKLSQNKGVADFSGVVAGLESVGETDLATLMREFREA